MNAVPLIPAPPPEPPPRGFQYYLPEYYYLLEEPKIARRERDVARLTAEHLARWADGYRARSLRNPNDENVGWLSGSPEKRVKEVEQILKCIEGQTKRRSPTEFGLALLSGGYPIYNLYDGFPGHLTLDPEQYRTLQRVWAQYGLPTDLYYPASDQQSVIEPRRMHGGIVRVLRRYTPRYWSVRPKPEGIDTEVPDEDQRFDAFVDACQKFLDALDLRIAELTEPDCEHDRGEVSRLRRLRGEVRRAQLRTPRKDSGV